MKDAAETIRSAAASRISRALLEKSFRVPAKDNNAV